MPVTQIEHDVEAVFDLLVGEGPFDGTAADLAAAVGLSVDRLWSAINRIRSAEFVAENRWTIPYVPKGTSPKTWTVADDRENADDLRDGAKIRVPEVVEYLRRAHAQMALGQDLADGRTDEGRWLAYVSTSLAALVAGGELLAARIEA